MLKIAAVGIITLMGMTTGANADTAKFLKSSRIETTKQVQTINPTTPVVKPVTEAPVASQTPPPVTPAPATCRDDQWVRADNGQCIDKPKPAPQPTYTYSAPSYSDDGSAKMFIYMHESGNNPNSVNRSSGACGLGQALPCSKMGCNLGDYACQDAYFTGYMQSRYGTWENARAFWISHSWW